MVFYLEHDFGSSFSEFFNLLSKHNRFTLIRYALMYIITAIGNVSRSIVKNAFEHCKFGKFFVHLTAIFIKVQSLDIIAHCAQFIA